MKIEFPDFSIDEFTARCAKRFCPRCGAPITENRTGRKKKFCSDKCRLKYWKYVYRHRDKNADTEVISNENR